MNLYSIENQKYGKDVVINFEASDIDNGDKFWTDSNGLGMLERTINKTQTQPIAGNYYPITTAIALRGTSKQMTIVTERTHGGSGLTPGNAELMVNRRLFADDGRGVGQPLNETNEFGYGI